MRNILVLSLFCSLMLSACGQNNPNKKTIDTSNVSQEEKSKIYPNGNTVTTRFLVPKGFERTIADSASFKTFLRNLPLKPDGEKVKYYNGKTKPIRNIYAAVVDLPIGKRDLHQCADAVIRLRAEYLFKHERYDEIQFNFTNGFKADYANWRKGNRIAVNGNSVHWIPKTQSTSTPESFWKYMEMVFSYAGTASLSKELKSVSIQDLQIGDVFIQGGFPGHAVIVIDMAKNKSTGEQLFLLAQSYMPAQEIQVLNNPNNLELNPWYSVSQIQNEVRTPEWVFNKSDIKRF